MGAILAQAILAEAILATASSDFNSSLAYPEFLLRQLKSPPLPVMAVKTTVAFACALASFTGVFGDTTCNLYLTATLANPADFNDCSTECALPAGIASGANGISAASLVLGLAMAVGAEALVLQRN